MLRAHHMSVAEGKGGSPTRTMMPKPIKATLITSIVAAFLVTTIGCPSVVDMPSEADTAGASGSAQSDTSSFGDAELTAGTASDAQQNPGADGGNPDGSAPVESSAPSSDGDCCVEADTFVASPRVGCQDAEVEACVCGDLPACCTDAWSLQCVAVAALSCDSCPDLSDNELLVIAALLGDSDHDGRSDIDEILAGLDPLNRFDGPDIDGDGILNGEDDDVDGDGTLNAYDDDVDGDGIKNEDDDDIDGDGLFNHTEDDDDDGDGIDNRIDNDDDANGLPDEDDETADKADQDRDGDGDDDDVHKDCDPKNENFATECDGEEFSDAIIELLRDVDAERIRNDKVVAELKALLFAAIEAALGDADEDEDGVLDSDEIAEMANNVLCDSDDDCGLDERCTWKTCTVDEVCRPANDRDGDGLCDGDDIDIDGDGNLDDNNNKIPDHIEKALGFDPHDDDDDAIEGLEFPDFFRIPDDFDDTPSDEGQ